MSGLAAALPTFVSAWRGLTARLRDVSSDLPLFALLLVPFGGLAVLAAKVTAAWHTYESVSARILARLLLRVVPQDLLFIAFVGALVLLSRRIRWRLPARPLVLAALYGVFSAAVFVHFVNAGFFMYFGAPLNADLVALVPAMARYAPHVIDA
jgi:hypothetical protein